MRTPATWIRYGQLGLVAFLIDGYAPTVQLLARDLQVPMEVASLHGTAFGIGFILASFLSASITRRFGRVRTIQTGALGLCLGTLLYVVSPSVTGTLAGIAIAGCFGTLIQSTAFADLADRHGRWARAALNEGSAVSQAAGIAAPILVAAASASVFGWRVGMAVVFLLAAVLGVAEAAAARSAKKASLIKEPQTATPQRPGKSTRFSPRFWIVWGSMTAVLGIEFAMAMWSPVWLVSQSGLSSAVATSGPALMLGGVLLGRFTVSRMAVRWGADVLLIASILVSACGFILFWWTSIPVIALAALAVVGLGIGGQFPLSLARLIASSAGQADRASALGTLALGLAIAGAPLGLGLLQQGLSLSTAFLLVPALAATSLILVVLSPTKA